MQTNESKLGVLEMSPVIIVMWMFSSETRLNSHENMVDSDTEVDWKLTKIKSHNSRPRQLQAFLMLNIL